jgi:gamma-glutamyltranspeptidase/glutathione hydrolase
MVLLAAMGILDGLELQQALDQPRFHHQYLPDEVQHESGGFTEEESAELVRRGHKLRMFERGYGNMHAVSLDRGTGVMQAASDRRGDGEAALLLGTQVQLVESAE